ncbi:MAG: ketol-acid reductoisomerase [Actinobacteria bacterium]|nr:ketol-acid reductoisomerase [Actinomycetota bacterium]
MKIWYEHDGDPAALAGQRVAVVGYGNQGRSWALNLRDSGLDVSVCVRADETRERAEADGFAGRELEEANDLDVICALVPDDVIPDLPLAPRADALTVVASGYTLAFDRLDPPGDQGMVAPRMLGPEVRRCYDEGIGFITAVGVHRDVTGTAQARVLALARAVGGLKQGGIEMTTMQEAVLDLAVEQALAPALQHVHTTFVRVMLEHGIPLEAVLTEIGLSGEMERTMRLVRLEGYAAQMEHHSPTSQYGQLSRRDAFSHLDVAAGMREIVDGIESGAFADEWDAERDAGYPHLTALKEAHVGEAVRSFEADLRARLGELAGKGGS